jgi:hypothetical protein
MIAAALAALAVSPKQQALAYWRSKCRNPPTELMWMPSVSFNALYGNCNAGDGSDQRVFFFDRGRFVGTDGLGSSRGIIGLWREGDTIAFMYVLYKRNDPNCCATGGGAIVRYRLTGERVKRIDPAPTGR